MTTFAIERVCSKCGAPLGCYEVDKERFVATKGAMYADFQEHNPHEVSFDYDENDVRVKLTFGTCSTCRSYL